MIKIDFLEDNFPLCWLTMFQNFLIFELISCSVFCCCCCLLYPWFTTIKRLDSIDKIEKGVVKGFGVSVIYFAHNLTPKGKLSSRNSISSIIVSSKKKIIDTVCWKWYTYFFMWVFHKKNLFYTRLTSIN